MNPMLLILLLLITGAILFFTSGYTLSLWRRRELHNLILEDDLRKQVVVAETKNNQLAQDVENLNQARSQNQKLEKQLRQQLTDTKNSLAVVTQKSDEAGSVAADLVISEQERIKLNQELEKSTKILALNEQTIKRLTINANGLSSHMSQDQKKREDKFKLLSKQLFDSDLDRRKLGDKSKLLSKQLFESDLDRRKLGDKSKLLSKQLQGSEQNRRELEDKSKLLSEQLLEAGEKVNESALITEENTKLLEQVAVFKSNFSNMQNKASLAEGQSSLELEEYRRKVALLFSTQKENAELKLRVQEVAYKASLSETLEKQVKELRAKLFIKEDDILPLPTTDKKTEGSTLQEDMEEMLSELVEMNQVRSAIVADSQGLLVGGSGESAYFEGLAAIAGRIEEVSQRIGDVLPFSELKVVQLKDKNDAIVACRFFIRDEELLVLGTLGSNVPPGESALEMTVAGLTNE